MRKIELFLAMDSILNIISADGSDNITVTVGEHPMGVVRMARPLRIEYSDAFYHVMHRGNAGSDIFDGNRDRKQYLDYFGKAVERHEIKVHSYCRVTNHL